MQFLHCAPNLFRQENYVDEAERFYNDPNHWMLENPSSSLSDYLVLFDVLLENVSSHLAANDYNLIGNFFHADLVSGRVGSRVLVFEKDSHTLSRSSVHCSSIYC